MKKILFLIRSLNAGGAERQLVVTAKGLAERGHQVIVLTFYSGGFYANELIDTKVQLLSLHKKGRWDLLAFIFRLLKVLREKNTDVIYGFLNTANILTVLLRAFIPPTRVVWGVRASNVDLEQYDWLSRCSYWMERRLSRFADCIVANSHAGLEYAVKHDFPRSKMVVIPNGIDTDRYRPDETAGVQLRKLWGIGEKERLIGLVGRIDPMKGHTTFLQAAVLVNQQLPNVRFVCVGSGMAEYEKTIRKIATELELDDVLIWAGVCSDMVAVYNALDLLSSSSSFGEGFPNVVGEAMSCGVPCVVTDVGDSARIIGELGQVISPNNVEQLAKALLVELNLKNRGDILRARITSQYSLARLYKKTEKIVLAG